MLEVLNDLIPNIMNKLPEFWQAILDFFIMLGITGAVSFIFGTLFGVISVSYTHLINANVF